MLEVRTKRGRRKGARGFALLVIVLIVALLAATVTLALREATGGLAAAGNAKSAELVYADLGGGLSQAFATIAATDPSALVGVGETYDIFAACAVATPTCHSGQPFQPGLYLQPQTTAQTADSNSLYGIPVSMGLRPGQRTNVTGEDARFAYGYVVEVQLQADVDQNDPRNGGAVPAQERVSVGVRIPMRQSHANY
jgi:hypothetical protein